MTGSTDAPSDSLATRGRIKSEEHLLTRIHRRPGSEQPPPEKAKRKSLNFGRRFEIKDPLEKEFKELERQEQEELKRKEEEAKRAEADGPKKAGKCFISFN
jgi:hypothetical protein